MSLACNVSVCQDLNFVYCGGRAVIFEVPILDIADHNFLIIVTEINVREFNLFRILIEINLKYESLIQPIGFLRTHRIGNIGMTSFTT